MKTSTHEEISFVNSSVGIYLNKIEGAVAVDFKNSETVLYLNVSLYQALAWLLVEASATEKLMSFITWKLNPTIEPKTKLIEIHGPDHAVCLVCGPKHERVQLSFEIGVSIDLKFSDFKSLVELISEAQDDLEWRKYLLQLSYSGKSSHHKREN